MSCPCYPDKDAPATRYRQQDEEKPAVGVGGGIVQCTCAAQRKAADGLIRCKNPNLANLTSDCLYHLNLGTATHDLEAMFGDVKFVCMGGAPNRMKMFADFIKQELNLSVPTGTSLTDISKYSYRYAMYKAGPVISVSHGMGVSSISIVLHEMIKLVHYAKCKNPIFFRIGTCGGLGIEPGTLIVSEAVCDTSNRDTHEIMVLGYPVRRPAKLDQKIATRLKKFARPDDGYETISGKTMCTYDFYEEQARLDGAICEYTEKDKMEYLERLKSYGITNIEMEGVPFASLTYQCGVQAGMVCVCIVNRLKGDQIEGTREQLDDFQQRPQVLVGRYIKKYFEKLAEKKQREMAATTV